MLSQRSEKNTISPQESIALSYIRIASCIMIVICHFMQAYGNDWAYILNSGVQIFLLISGYIYGAKGIQSIRSFYIGRIKKVYKPYFIWTVLVALMLLLFNSEHISIRRTIAQILMIGTIDGQSHLWFMPILFNCYFILPVFARIKNSITAFIVLGLFVLGLTVAFLKTGEANILWVETYFIGYILGRWPNMIKILVVPLVLLFSAILFQSSNVIVDFQDKSILGRGLHILLALLIVTSFLTVFQISKRNNKLIFIKLPPPILAASTCHPRSTTHTSSCDSRRLS